MLDLNRRLGAEEIAVVLLMFAFSVMSYFDRTIMSIAGPQIMKEFSIPPTSMGSVYSAFILSYAILMTPGGWVADRLGPRMTLLLMGLGSALFTALTVAGGSHGITQWIGVVPTLWVIRLALGAVTAPLYPACARMCAQRIPVIHHARTQAFIIAGSSLGGAVSPILFSWMMAQLQWRKSFYLAALATALLAVIWIVAVKDRGNKLAEKRVHAPILKSWITLLRNRNLALLTLAYFTLGYFEYIFFYWIYYYFGEVRQVGYAASARYTTAVFLTMMVMMPLGGWVSDRLTKSYGPRFGRRVVPITGLTSGAILLCVATLTPSIPLTAVLLSLAIGFTSVCEGPFWSLTIEIGGDDVGSAGGILNTGGNVGGFFAPVLTPLIASYFGWSWGLYSGSLMVIAGAVACYFVDLKRTKLPGVPSLLASPEAL
jgi:ACS family glucarate transporter-like MFS transporter